VDLFNGAQAQGLQPLGLEWRTRELMTTTAAILTPAGRGAVAVISVEGDNAIEFVSCFFSPRNAVAWQNGESGRILYGRWSANGNDANAPAEDVIVCRVSKTAIEVHCHGGVAASAKILEDLANAGAQSQDWKAWISEQEPNRIRAAARVALASAPTERTAGILLDQYNGALENAVREIADQLNRDATAAAAELEKLIERATVGLHLTEPWRVVIAGAPNVGKSSLINAILGYERAIVFDQPGTTRDVVRATTALNGWPMAFADTAGLRTTADPLEAEGIERAKNAASQADCLLLVFDASQPWNGECQALADEWSGAIVAYNKSDLTTELAGNKPEGIFTSALHRRGIEDLIDAIVCRLVSVDLLPGDAVPFTSEQVEQLQLAASSIGRQDFAAARLALLALCFDG
jgi:tRNA modification GTPase